MKEYIDKKDAINLLWLFADETCASVVWDFENLTAEDVVEVVHGKWETEIDDELGILKHTCQACGFVKRTDIHVALNWNYCPNCGAKLDLEE